MRKLLAVLIILAGAYAGTAYILGGQVRERYFSVLEEYERYGIVSLSNHAYERGFLSSTAQTLVEVRVPGDLDDTGEAGVSRFIVRHAMQHGPLTGKGGDFFRNPGLARVDSTIEPWVVGGSADNLFTQYPELARATSEVHVGFEGRVHGDVLIPAVDRSIDGEHVIWEGLTLRAEIVPSSRSMRGELNMPGLVVKTGEGSIKFEAVSSNFDLSEVMPLVYAGHINAGIAAMDITPADGDAIRVSELNLSSDSSCEDSLYQYAQTIGVQSITVGESAYGPAFCELAGKNIDANALSQFQASLQELYRTMSDTDDLFYDRVGELYGSLFAQVLAGTPEIHMPRLQVVTPMGEMTGAFSVKMTSPVEGAALNPLLLLQHLEAGAQVAVHEELLKGLLRMSLGQDGEPGSDELEILVQLRYNEQIEPLLAQNLLVRDGDVIKADAMFANGRLAVNGQAVPLF